MRFSFDALGILDVLDFKEVMRSDLEVSPAIDLCFGKKQSSFLRKISTQTFPGGACKACRPPTGQIIDLVFK